MDGIFANAETKQPSRTTLRSCPALFCTFGVQIRSSLKHHTNGTPMNTNEHQWNTNEHQWTPVEHQWTPMEHQWTPMNTNGTPVEHQWTPMNTNEHQWNTNEHQWTPMNTSRTPMNTNGTPMNTNEHQWNTNGTPMEHQWTPMEHQWFTNGIQKIFAFSYRSFLICPSNFEWANYDVVSNAQTENVSLFDKT